MALTQLWQLCKILHYCLLYFTIIACLTNSLSSKLMREGDAFVYTILREQTSRFFMTLQKKIDVIYLYYESQSFVIM